MSGELTRFHMLPCSQQKDRKYSSGDQQTRLQRYQKVAFIILILTILLPLFFPYPFLMVVAAALYFQHYCQLLPDLLFTLKQKLLRYRYYFWFSILHLDYS